MKDILEYTAQPGKEYLEDYTLYLIEFELELRDEVFGFFISCLSIVIVFGLLDFLLSTISLAK